MLIRPRYRTAVAAVAALALAAAALRADVVTLKNGGRVEGKIVAESAAGVEIDTRFGRQKVSADQIAKIEKGQTAAEQIAARRRALADGDVAGRWEIYQSCRELGLKKEAEALAREVLALDPQHAGANELFGNVLYLGRYVAPAERDRLAKEAHAAEMAARGLVEWKGTFVTPEDKERLEKGMVLVDGAWLEEADAKAKQGYVKIGDRWVHESERALDETKAEVEKTIGRDVFVASSDHVAVFSDVSAEYADRLAKLCEKGYATFARDLELAQDLEWLGRRRLALFVFRVRPDYEKYVDLLARLPNLGSAWAARAKPVVSVWSVTPHPLGATYVGNRGEQHTAHHCANMLGHILINRYRIDLGKRVPPFFDESFAALTEYELLGRNVVFSRATGRYEKPLDRDAIASFEDGKWAEPLRAALRSRADTPLDQAVRRDTPDLAQMDLAKGMALYLWWRGGGGGKIKQFFDTLLDGMPMGTPLWTHPTVLQAVDRAFHAVEKKDIPVVDRELRDWVMTKMP